MTKVVFSFPLGTIETKIPKIASNAPEHNIAEGIEAALDLQIDKFDFWQEIDGALFVENTKTKLSFIKADLGSVADGEDPIPVIHTNMTQENSDTVKVNVKMNACKPCLLKDDGCCGTLCKQPLVVAIREYASRQNGG